MKHKLVKFDNGLVITGQDLKDLLTGFQINPIAPIIQFTKPARPSTPRWFITPTGVVANPEWVAYENAFKDFNQAKAEDLLRLKSEKLQAEILLKTWFDGIVSYVEVGKNPNGTKRYDWVPSEAYKFSQCVDKLTGANRPENVIDFICFKYFGS